MLGKCAPPTWELPDTWFLRAPLSHLGRTEISLARKTPCWKYAPFSHGKNVHHSHARAPAQSGQCTTPTRERHSLRPCKHEAHCWKYAPFSHGSARELPAKFHQLYKSARRHSESSLHALNISIKQLCEALTSAWKVRPSHTGASRHLVS